ncbi:hypothetical protein [Clavibacter tessellarius]|uniref:hypothetical protein n=1 Tax=Clavibacter tessellarius TaxID=31965 RepID=UPI00324C64E1
MPSGPVTLGEEARRGSSRASSTTSMPPSAARAASLKVPCRGQRAVGRPVADFIQMASAPTMPTAAIGTR